MLESILKHMEGFLDGNRWVFCLGWKSISCVWWQHSCWEQAGEQLFVSKSWAENLGKLH
jgi:hypothetical protein